MKDTSSLQSKTEQKARMQQMKQHEMHERVVRILSKDIDGRLKVYPGLTKIRGISWSFSNAICRGLNINRNKKISELTPEEIEKISNFVKNPNLPEFLMNRRNDFSSGKTGHLHGVDLELRTEFDIKRLKKIKSYRGLRHASGQPTRGQRTKAHFRKNKLKGVGIKKKMKKGKEGAE